MEEINIELVDVTPGLALEWLAFNKRNRNVRRRTVLAYAADMAAGQWILNGESIKRAADGMLLDGQHRLLAVIEADVTVTMLVVSGLEHDAQETVDQGVARKFPDVLKLRGEVSPNVLSAIVRRVNTWEAKGAAGSMLKTAYAPTAYQLLSTLEKYPWLRDLVNPASYTATGCALPASIIGFCWWLFTSRDDDLSRQGDAETFFARLRDGQELAKGDPIYQLRQTAANSKALRGARSERFLIAITIKAWNAYRRGDSIGLLTFRPGGAHPERFPEPE